MYSKLIKETAFKFAVDFFLETSSVSFMNVKIKMPKIK